MFGNWDDLSVGSTAASENTKEGEEEVKKKTSKSFIRSERPEWPAYAKWVNEFKIRLIRYSQWIVVKRVTTLFVYLTSSKISFFLNFAAIDYSNFIRCIRGSGTTERDMSINWSKCHRTGQGWRLTGFFSAYSKLRRLLNCLLLKRRVVQKIHLRKNRKR